MSGAKRLLAAFLSFFVLSCVAPAAQAQPRRVLVFGDSLTSGFDVTPGRGFSSSLARHLYCRGRGNLEIMKTSRAGDDTAVALERIPLAFSRGADVVIVQLGGNDMLSDVDPGVVYQNLRTVVRYSKSVGVRVILAGMVSLPKRDPTYKPRFDAIYPTLAAREKVALYPFFLEGAFGDPRLMQSDGRHPNEAGSDYIAARMAPVVERELRALDRRHSYGLAPH
jgi:acyl-CoA thioesterase-1